MTDFFFSSIFHFLCCQLPKHSVQESRRFAVGLIVSCPCFRLGDHFRPFKVGLGQGSVDMKSFRFLVLNIFSKNGKW